MCDIYGLYSDIYIVFSMCLIAVPFSHQGKITVKTTFAMKLYIVAFPNYNNFFP